MKITSSPIEENIIVLLLPYSNLNWIAECLTLISFIDDS